MISTRTTCTIALATALSLPCFAQSTSGTGTTSPGATTGTTSGTTTSTAARTDGEDRGNWGWLGLLGLAGLLGLRRPSDAGHRVDSTRTSAQR
jgi:MYXO-CTERM domain-containing protein